MKKILLFTLLSAALLVTACGNEAGTEKERDNGITVTGVSRQKPLLTDHDAKTVTVYTEVNGKYFTTPTRHGLVFKEGSNGDKSVLKAWADQLDFYQALEDIGAVPGDNVTLETKNAVVEGSELKISVNWEGSSKDYTLDEIIIDESGKGFMPRFGGNKDRSASIQTGCIFCLDTCPVGITSNAAYAQGSFAGGTAKFFGNQDVLPPDGTPVAVKFTLK